MFSRRVKVALIILAAGLFLTALPLLRLWPMMKAMRTISDHGGEVRIGSFDYQGEFWSGFFASLIASYYVKIDGVHVQIPSKEIDRQSLRDAIAHLKPMSLALFSSAIDDEELGRIWKQLKPQIVTMVSCQLGEYPFREIGGITSLHTMVIRDSLDSSTNLEGLKNATSLKNLSIICEAPTVIDISPMEGAPGLESLYLWKVQPYNNQPLPALPSLEYLSLRESIYDLGDLRRFPAIQQIKSQNANELRERYRDHSPAIQFTSSHN